MSLIRSAVTLSALLLVTFIVTLVITLVTLSPSAQAKTQLLITDTVGGDLLWVDPKKGEIHRLAVGAAPFSVVTNGKDRAYVATVEGVAFVDLKARKVIRTVRYAENPGRPRQGEYRPGGMGITIAPDGRRLYVGVHTKESWDRLDVIDIFAGKVVASTPIGQRPFDVLITPDGKTVFTVDHDSYTMTEINTATLKRSQISVAPLGNGAYDKPHYAALTEDGRIFLPFQGRALLEYDLADGSMGVHGLTGETHQHDVAYCQKAKTLVIIGTGAAGGAEDGPSLTLFNINEQSEVFMPLKRPHEQLVLDANCRYAYLTGGEFLSGGWNGITVVDLKKLTSREIPLKAFPLGISLAP